MCTAPVWASMSDKHARAHANTRVCICFLTSKRNSKFFHVCASIFGPRRGRKQRGNWFLSFMYLCMASMESKAREASASTATWTKKPEEWEDSHALQLCVDLCYVFVILDKLLHHADSRKMWRSVCWSSKLDFANDHVNTILQHNKGCGQIHVRVS